jgi:DNA-binding HxlR family transcriptional regulator
LQYIVGEEEPVTDIDEKTPSRPLRPSVSFKECPIKIGWGVLGKKWTMMILRDVGFRKIDRFNRLLESIHGLTPRVLSMRLKELEQEGFITCVESKRSPMMVRWALTEKGEDTMPILMYLIAFGSKWYADVAFEDKRPRTLSELFTSAQARAVIEQYARE